MLREYKTFSFKAGNTDGLDPDCFQGYAATFGGIDSCGDMIERGAFAKTIADFLSDGAACWQHDWASPIGKPLDMYEDSNGLFIKARISQTAAGKDALILLRDGVVKKMSIGYQTVASRTLTEEEGIALFGELEYATALLSLPWWSDGIRVLTEIKLFEVSLVTVPADMGADVTGVKGQPPTGLTLDDHFQTVHAAERELITRVKSLAEIRLKEGRVLSEGNRAKLETMSAQLKGHVEVLDDLIASATPAADPEDGSDPDEKSADETSAETKAQEELLHEIARFQRTTARINGVAV